MTNHFDECFRNCKSQFGQRFRSVVNQLGSGESDEERFASIFVASGEAKKKLLSEVSTSPLMLHRFHRLEQILANPKNCLNMMETHSNRVNWQLNRIYRERNDIVHSGTQSPFIESLVENAYAYYRNVFLALERVNSKFRVAHPDRSLELVQKMYENKIKELTGLSGSKTIDERDKPKRLLKILYDNRLGI